MILLDEKRELEIREDDAMKIINLPAWQVEELVARDRTSKPRALFAEALVSIPVNLCRARGRLDQLIGLLRHVEALRLYAAAHDGALPATLADVSVPLPDDPFTGKPFRYEHEGPTAALRGTPPPGFGKVAPFQPARRVDAAEVTGRLSRRCDHSTKSRAKPRGT